MKKEDGIIPSLHIIAESIPEAFYKAMNAVHKKAYRLRTQYDRKDSAGDFIDPPGKDAKVCIEIKNPFAEPRFSVVGYSEVGKYIAEIFGAKDHLVVPMAKLLEHAKTGKKLEATEWPYTYHQRLFAYPLQDGTTMDQTEVQLNRLAKDPITRRAIMQTGVPYIDCFLQEDLPCLREIQLRAVENSEGELVLGMNAWWRSRDLFKAWSDNLIAMSNLHRQFAQRLHEKTGRKVRVGNYVELSGSLHFYGQDYTDKGLEQFFVNFPNFHTFNERCWNSNSDQAKGLVIYQLEQLLTEDTWRFGDEQKNLIKGLISDLNLGKYLP